MSQVAPVSPKVAAELRDMYADMGRFFADIPRKHDFGYKILNAPPLHRPRVLFIGYNPKGGAFEWAQEAAKKSHLTWPDVAEYATASGRGWKLAEVMRRMFYGRLDLHQCVGTNAIFLRSEDEDQYEEIVGPHRDRVEAFCRKHALRIIELLEPESIVFIGTTGMKKFCHEPTSVFKNKRGTSIALTGTFGHHTVKGVAHLSKFPLTNEERARVVEFMLGESGGNVRAAA